MRKRNAVMFAAILGVCLLALPALAQDAPVESSNLPATESIQVPGSNDVNTYGLVNATYHWLPAAAFVPRDTSAVWRDASYGRLRLVTAGGGPSYGMDLMAPVNIPAGALLNGIRYYWCDSDATNQITAWLTKYPQADFSGFTDLISTTSGATPGCVSVLAHPTTPLTIDNEDAYVINIRFGAVSTTLDFRGARLYYHLQMSPAPAVASFTDVGTGYWAFQGIEALKSSGITTGCNPPTYDQYCPEQAVTRAQMAVFLSRALGLHW